MSRATRLRLGAAWSACRRWRRPAPCPRSLRAATWPGCCAHRLSVCAALPGPWCLGAGRAGGCAGRPRGGPPGSEAWLCAPAARGTRRCRSPSEGRQSCETGRRGCWGKAPGCLDQSRSPVRRRQKCLARLGNTSRTRALLRLDTIQRGTAHGKLARDTAGGLVRARGAAAGCRRPTNCNWGHSRLLFARERRFLVAPAPRARI